MEKLYSTADYVSICRHFIREPNLVDRWKMRQFE